MRILIDTRFPTHWKLRRLALLLDDKNAGMYLVRLWAWAFENDAVWRTGRLDRFTEAEIAAAAEWDGPPRRFIAAVVRAGLLDAEPLRIHEWKEHNGRARKRYEREAERIKRYRDRIKREAEAQRNQQLGDRVRSTNGGASGDRTGIPSLPLPSRSGSPPPTSSAAAPAAAARSARAVRPRGGGGGPPFGWPDVLSVLPKWRGGWERDAWPLYEGLGLKTTEDVDALVAWIERQRQTQPWRDSPPTPLAIFPAYGQVLQRQRRRIAVEEAGHVDLTESKRPHKSKPRRESNPTPATSAEVIGEMFPPAEVLERDGVKARRRPVA